MPSLLLGEIIAYQEAYPTRAESTMKYFNSQFNERKRDSCPQHSSFSVSLGSSIVREAREFGKKVAEQWLSSCRGWNSWVAREDGLGHLAGSQGRECGTEMGSGGWLPKIWRKKQSWWLMLGSGLEVWRLTKRCGGRSQGEGMWRTHSRTRRQWLGCPLYTQPLPALGAGAEQRKSWFSLKNGIG